MESMPGAGRLRIATLSFVAALALAAATAGLHASKSDAARAYDKPVTSGRAIVLLEHRSDAAVDRVVDRNNLNVKNAIPEIGAVAVKPPAGVSIAELRDKLVDQPGVKSVEPELLRRVRYRPNDPGYAGSDANSPNGVRQWNLIKEGFGKAWKRTWGSGVKLAVLDTGIDGNHNELRPRIVASADQAGTGGARNDTYGHGTHVAGLACANGNNHAGMVGAAFKCSLIVEKVGPGPDLTDSGIASGIVDATDKGAKVISMSFGGAGADSVIKSAIAYAWNRHVVMIAAASNNHTTDEGYPARYLQGVGTASNIKNGHGLVVTDAAYGGHNANAGYGSGVSIAAYGAAHINPVAGQGIFSTFPHAHTDIEDEDCGLFGCTSTPRTTFGGDSGYAYLEGTSMATPQVAGAAALIRAIRPRLSVHKVLQVLKREASGTYSSSSQLGWGIVNAGAAVNYARKHYKR